MARARKALLLIGSFAGFAAAGGAAQPPEFKFQQASFWCWAAVSQMVESSVDPAGDYAQSTQAEKVIEGCTTAPDNTCKGANPLFGDCNSPGVPTFGYFSFHAETAPSPLPWDQLKSELDSCRPVTFGWCVPPGGLQDVPCPDETDGHWLLAVAANVCKRQNGPPVPMVNVFNPAPCCAGQKLWIPYTVYGDGVGQLAFWRNYFQVRRDLKLAAPNTECRLSDTAVTPTANFEGADGEQLAIDVVKSCWPGATAWLQSSLIRTEVPPASLDGGPKAAPAVRRVVIDVANAATTSAAELRKLAQTFPVIWAYPIHINGQWVATVVLEQSAPQSYRLIAVEDSLSALRLDAKRMEAAKAKAVAVDSMVEVFVVGTGTRFVLAGNDGVVVDAEIDCDSASSTKGDISIRPYEELIGRLLAQ